MSKTRVLVFHGTFLCQQLKAIAWNEAITGWYFFHIAQVKTRHGICVFNTTPGIFCLGIYSGIS